MSQVLAAVAFLLVTSASGEENASAAYDFRDREGDARFVYASLSAQPASERHQTFARFSATMKADLWVLHFEKFMAERPQLTNEQRAVILEARAIVTSAGFFEAPKSIASAAAEHPRASESSRATVDDLVRRAKSVFSATDVRRLFNELGAPASSRRRERSDAAVPDVDGGDECPVSNGGAAAAQNAGDVTVQIAGCTCSPYDDWCSGLFYRCVGGGCHWSTSGCGTFWQQSCTGLCKAYT